MQVKQFKGTGVAIVTPFRKDESVDFKALQKVVEHIITNNVEYIVVLGTTGEAVTLSKDEKRAIIDTVIEINCNRLPIVVGMGGYNTQEVINNIKATDFKGIAAILSVTPYYNKPNQRGLYLHYKSIATASPVPVILYNVPGRTSVNLSADTVLTLANEFKNIVAVKEASGNFDQIMQIIRDKPKDFQVISGDDALSLPLISLGANGVISVIANAFPFEFSEMVRKALKGACKEAREIHFSLFEIIRAIFEDGSPAGVKAALSIMKIAENYVRLPLAPVKESTYKKIAGLVEQLQSNKK